ncbi:hypothetical protein HPP92_019404 [Vanilla planifolia]|uniref:Uncharacterized protein n=1 Tax=Vanilla planifolia TaxID=51239 RepID=A0A835Q6R1_VANPL|nr:hypothetical protein HPP92_019404 [Vanilla planifolia]
MYRRAPEREQSARRRRSFWRVTWRSERLRIAAEGRLKEEGRERRSTRIARSREERRRTERAALRFVGKESAS